MGFPDRADLPGLWVESIGPGISLEVVADLRVKETSAPGLEDIDAVIRVLILTE